jgi:hypothetical protein
MLHDSQNLRAGGNICLLMMSSKVGLGFIPSTEQSLLQYRQINKSLEHAKDLS